MTAETGKENPSATGILLDSFNKLYTEFRDKLPTGYHIQACPVMDPSWLMHELMLLEQHTPQAREFRYSHEHPDINILRRCYKGKDGIALVLFQDRQEGAVSPTASAVLVGSDNLNTRGAGIAFCSVVPRQHNVDLLAHVLFATAYQSGILDNLAIEIDMNNEPMKRAFRRWTRQPPHSVSLTNICRPDYFVPPVLTKPEIHCPLTEGVIHLHEPVVVSILIGSMRGWKQLHKTPYQ